MFVSVAHPASGRSAEEASASPPSISAALPRWTSAARQHSDISRIRCRKLRGADHRSPAARLDCIDVASAADGGGRTPTSFRSARLVEKSTLRPRLRRLVVSLGRRRPWIEANSVEECETGNRRRIALGADWRRSLAANQPLRRETPQ